MTPDTDLEALMARYQTGDLNAATALIRELSPLLYKLFAMQTLSREHADDLLQETWLRIHHVRHTYRVGERFLPWFFAIARNTRVDHYRSLRRVSRREQQVKDLPERSADPHWFRGGSGVDLAALLAELPESQREVISMLKVAGMSLEDVARATSSTTGAVKQKAHRAYTRLRSLLTGADASSLHAGEDSHG